jgi:RNA polymerase sigma-70 factor, ECF subfamily
MRRDVREKLEQEIRQLCRRGDVASAVTRALDGFGPEIMGLMVSRISDYERSQEAYSHFGENLWRGLPGFRWESSFRTWAYRLAHNACYQVLRRECARPERPMGIAVAPDMAIGSRSELAPWQRTSMKDRLHSLYDCLSPEQRMLLFLRVQRQMPWLEVARVMAEDEWALTHVELKRKAAALRQQFKSLKDHLRSLFQQEGWLVAEDSSIQW